MTQIELKLSQKSPVSINIEDIDFAEYRLYWDNIKEFPGILIHMKDGKEYKVHYAIECRILAEIFRKNGIKFNC